MGRCLIETPVHVLRWIALVVLLAASQVAPASAETRLALVIGNATYRTLPPLTSRRDDSALIAGRLKALGFGVVALMDTSQSAMRRGIADFVATVRAAPPGTIAFVYYTGYALSDHRSTLWMVPSDASLLAPKDIPQELVSLATLIDGLRGTPSVRAVLVFDACTDSPFDPPGTPYGLPSAEGMLVALPSAAGTCPRDGSTGVSPYAEALAAGLGGAGRTLDEMFRRVRDRVFETTEGAQRPATSNRLLADIVLREERPLPVPSIASPSSNSGPAVPVALGRKLAFTAGINDYPNLPRESQLQRAVADADAVAQTLETIGFTVTRLGQDASRLSFLRRFAQFAGGIRKGDTALVFFAGHGVGIDGTNHLLPADVPLLGEGEEFLVKGAAMAETDLIAALHERGARVTVMVIDACRNNPFPRAGTRSLGMARGLTIKEPPSGVFSLYSAGFGQRALDQFSRQEDTDPNSVFTRVFIKKLRKPGLNLIDLGESIRDEVADLADSDGFPQVPAVYNQIRNARGVFLGGVVSEPLGAAPPP